MPAILIQIDAYDPVAAAAVVLRGASFDDERVCHLNGETWFPAIASLPSLRYDLFDGGFGGRITTPQTSFAIAVEAWPNFARYMLADGRVRIWTGEPGAAWGTYVARFDGRIQAQPAIANGIASIGITVDDKWLDAPLLATYAGTGGVEGDAALKGKPKPLALGAPRYAPGAMIDPINNVLQLSAYGLIEGVEYAMERLARFGASTGNYASYAALVAAAIPAGQWGTCYAAGLVRHGAPPGGLLSYHVQGDKAGVDGWARLPGAVIRRIAAIAGGALKVDDASLTALNASRPWNVSIEQGDQTTARDLIQRIAASVNAVAGVDWLGKLFVIPIGIGASALTLDATGAALPAVAEVGQIEIEAPSWKLAIGAKPTWLVHPLSDVAFTALIIERGRYDAAESYREGHVVDLADGSRWLYVNAAASIGHAPPAVGTSNAWWEQLSPPTSVGDLGDAGALATLDAVAFGNGTIQQSPGGATAVNAAYRTDLGTAAAIAGQGALATSNSADFASQVTGAAKPEDNASSGDNWLPNGNFTTNTDGWALRNTHSRIAGAAGDPGPAFIRHDGNVVGYSDFSMVAAKVLAPGQLRQFVSLWSRQSEAGRGVIIGFNCYDAAGAYLGGSPTVQFYGSGYVDRVFTGQAPANVWVNTLWTADLPAGTVKAQFYVQCESQAGHHQDFTGFRITGTQAAADVTALDPKVSTSDGYASSTDNMLMNSSMQRLDVTGFADNYHLAHAPDAPYYSLQSYVGGIDPPKWIRALPGHSGNGVMCNYIGPFFNRWPGGSRRLFISGRIRSNGSAGGYIYVSVTAFHQNVYMGGYQNYLQALVADTWLHLKAGTYIELPEGVDSYDLRILPTAPGGGSIDFTDIRLAPTEYGATFGADININVGDSFSGTYVTLPRNEIKTPLGTAAAIAGQGTLATQNSATWGAQVSGRPAELTDGRVSAGLDASGDLARNLTTTRRDASNLLGRTGGGAFTGELAADVTSGHTAAAIAGQAATATSSDFSAVTGATKPEANATYTKDMAAWAGATTYKIGDFVQYANSSYIATANHTSNASFPPGNAGNTSFRILAAGGLRTEFIYIRSNATPAAPTGNTPAGWSVGSIPATPTDNAYWQSIGQKDTQNVLSGTWSTPVKISGQVPRGAYSSSATYYSNDLVTYNGGTYYTLQNNFTNQAPSGTAQANSYWGVQAAPGAAAGTGSQTLTLTLSGGSIGTTVNLRTLADAAGYTAGDLTLTVNITATYRGPPGGYGIRTGTFPIDKTIAITINNNAGALVEGGGGGGGGGGNGGAGAAGEAGSDAFYIEHNVSGGLIVNAGATLKAGGGGGGGGGSKSTLVGPPGEEELITTGGGGGGGGAPNGIGGPLGGAAFAGSDGTTGGGGAGGAKEGLGAGNGGAGGNYNTAGTAGANATVYTGGAGGAAGYAVRKNGKTCAVSGAGTITGTVG